MFFSASDVMVIVAASSSELLLLPPTSEPFTAPSLSLSVFSSAISSGQEVPLHNDTQRETHGVPSLFSFHLPPPLPPPPPRSLLPVRQTLQGPLQLCRVSTWSS